MGVSSVHSSIHSGISKASEITTASERSTNTTSTTSGASTIQFNSSLRARQEELPGQSESDKMEVESEAGASISTNLTSLSELTSTNKSVQGQDNSKMEYQN